MSADLHIHTNHSDGTDAPEEIVRKARTAGLKTIAITDHDIVSGIALAQKTGSEAGVEVIPGIEFTTETQKCEVHILGYFIDHTNRDFLGLLDKMQHSREDRIYKMVDKLKNLGINIEAKRVFEIAGHPWAGRPHVAKALLEKGYVSTFKEAFDRYIQFQGPAYVSHFKLLPENAVKLIRQVGGVAVYAHPFFNNAEEKTILPKLVKAGLQGLEAYYPAFGPSQTAELVELAEKMGLCLTGGSDYHGSIGGREIRSLGDFSIPDEVVEKLRGLVK
ncbi:MAG: PHP domain-containing protein [Candidatus Margulisbacteria bacterium]|nr:PHP domain-containing protein [Candidatus Margulisiibacteriota bacterium]